MRRAPHEGQNQRRNKIKHHEQTQRCGVHEGSVAHSLTATAIAAALAAFLDWRAWNRAEGAVGTAVTRLRLEQRMTLLAFVEPLTRIRWHDLPLGITANGTGQCRLNN
jgi:hypothetical protein